MNFYKRFSKYIELRTGETRKSVIYNWCKDIYNEEYDGNNYFILYMKKWLKYIIGIGATLLLVSVLINVIGIRKVNYFKEQEKEWIKEEKVLIEQREQLINVADALKKENILIDDRIGNKEKAFKILEDEKNKIMDNTDPIEYDELIRKLTGLYCGGGGSDTKDGVCPTN